MEKEEKKADLELLKLTIESREFKIKTLIEENDYWRGEAKELKEENKKFNKLKIRLYKNLSGDMWKEYQKFCEKNHI